MYNEKLKLHKFPLYLLLAHIKCLISIYSIEVNYMKPTLQAYLLSTITILMLSILVSLIIGTLFFFHITDTTFSNMIIWILGIGIYFLAGLVFGHYLQRKILIHLFVMLLIVLSIYFICIPITTFPFIRLLCKLLSFIIATILIQNKKGH